MMVSIAAMIDRLKLGRALMPLCGFCLLGAAPAVAADGTVALSPQQRDAVLEAAASRNADGVDGDGAHRAIHGEMGIEIGSRGTRALYGTTVIPLGQTGTAAFSFSTASQNGWYRRGR